MIFNNFFTKNNTRKTLVFIGVILFNVISISFITSFIDKENAFCWTPEDGSLASPYKCLSNTANVWMVYSLLCYVELMLVCFCLSTFSDGIIFICKNLNRSSSFLLINSIIILLILVNVLPFCLPNNFTVSNLNYLFNDFNLLFFIGLSLVFVEIYFIFINKDKPKKKDNLFWFTAKIKFFALFDFIATFFGLHVIYQMLKKIFNFKNFMGWLSSILKIVCDALINFYNFVVLAIPEVIKTIGNVLQVLFAIGIVLFLAFLWIKVNSYKYKKK